MNLLINKNQKDIEICNIGHSQRICRIHSPFTPKSKFPSPCSKEQRTGHARLLGLSRRCNPDGFTRPIVMLAIILVAGTLGPWQQQSWACPNCSSALSSNDSSSADSMDPANPSSTQAGASLATGFYYSILLLLAVPFTMASGLCGAFYLRTRSMTRNAKHSMHRSAASVHR